MIVEVKKMENYENNSNIVTIDGPQGIMSVDIQKMLREDNDNKATI